MNKINIPFNPDEGTEHVFELSDAIKHILNGKPGEEVMSTLTMVVAESIILSAENEKRQAKLLDIFIKQTKLAIAFLNANE